MTHRNGKFRKSILLYSISIFFGSLTIFLTFSIMDGMQNEVFEKINSFNYNKSMYYDTSNELDIDNYDNNGIETIVKIDGNNFSTFINIFAFNKFENFINKKISKHLLYNNNNYNSKSLLIGETFSSTYNINLGDTLIISDITNINPINGNFAIQEYVVANIFSFPFLNYDLNNAYLPYNKKFFNRKMNIIFNDNKINTSLKITNNLDSFNSLINAIKIEKYLYTGIGFLVVFISCIMIFNNTIMLMLEKLKQKIILRTLGMTNLYQLLIIFNTCITSIALFFALLTTFIITILNKKFLILNLIFINSPFKTIPMILNLDKLFISIIIIIIMTLISTILSYKSINNYKNISIQQ